MNEATQIKVKYKVVPVLISLLLGGFIGLLSETMMNVALPVLMKQWSLTASTAQWITTGYILVVSIIMPISALLLQWFTTRQLFATAICLFTLGTLAAGLAPGFGVLLIGRLIQAAGTAILMPVIFNTVLTIIPPAKRGAAMGMVGLVMMVAPALGPTLSGLIIDKLNWNWMFWVLIPFLIIDIIVGMINIENVGKITKPKIDVLSLFLSTIAFGGIIYGLSSVGEGDGGWGSLIVIATLGAGFVALLLFIWRQLTMKQPIMNLRAFKYPMFTAGTLFVVIGFLTIFATSYLLPIFMQGSLALSALYAGLLMLPAGLVNAILAPLVGRSFDKVGPRVLVIPGIMILAIDMWLFTGISVDTPIYQIIILHCFMTVGIALTLMPAQTNGLNQLPRELHPHGTAIMNTLQQLASAVGTALIVSVMTAGQKSYIKTHSEAAGPDLGAHSLAAGVNNAFILAACITLIGLIAGFFVRHSTIHVHAQAEVSEAQKQKAV
ncbi:UNVERIFIED_CONTAM: DHA2 family lincomycin resistance protein-like MFS transporter [Paenibacillus sp. PvR008]